MFLRITALFSILNTDATLNYCQMIKIKFPVCHQNYVDLSFHQIRLGLIPPKGQTLNVTQTTCIRPAVVLKEVCQVWESSPDHAGSLNKSQQNRLFIVKSESEGCGHGAACYRCGLDFHMIHQFVNSMLIDFFKLYNMMNKAQKFVVSQVLFCSVWFFVVLLRCVFPFS